MTSGHCVAVVITESWIHSDSRNFVREFKVPGYIMFHKTELYEKKVEF